MTTTYEIYQRDRKEPIRSFTKEGLAFHAYRTYKDSGRDVFMTERIEDLDKVKNGLWVWMDVEPNTGWWNEINHIRWSEEKGAGVCICSRKDIYDINLK